MPTVFISYRRDDTEFPAHALYDEIVRALGRDSVFVDIDSIPAGVDFRDHLNSWLVRCDVLLAIVGTQWLDVRNSTGERRLDNPDDFVRLEIESALSRGIRVVPILVGSAEMPSPKKLPTALADLPFRNALRLRSGFEFRQDVERIIATILQIPAGSNSTELSVSLHAGHPDLLRSSAEPPSSSRDDLGSQPSFAEDDEADDSEFDLVLAGSDDSGIDLELVDSDDEPECSAISLDDDADTILFDSLDDEDDGDFSLEDDIQLPEDKSDLFEQVAAAHCAQIEAVMARGKSARVYLATMIGDESASHATVDDGPSSVPVPAGRLVPDDQLISDNPSVQLLRALEYRYGIGVERSEEMAADFFHRAAQQGHVLAMTYMGSIYAQGNGVAGDPVRAADWNRQAADKGNPVAATELANAHLSGTGVEVDYDRAIVLYQSASEQGYPPAQFRLARCYQLGIGTPEDERTSETLYRKSAAAGYLRAVPQLAALRELESLETLLFLARCYEKGYGVDRDHATRISLLRQSALLGLRREHLTLAQYLEQSDDHDDQHEAVLWYFRLAAAGLDAAQQWVAEQEQHGNPLTQLMLGRCYEQSSNADASRLDSTRWYRRAAEGGSAEAQLIMGHCYRFGFGVDRDLMCAASWYEKAAEQGCDLARHELEWYRRCAEDSGDERGE